jgi:hypothetical protein
MLNHLGSSDTVVACPPRSPVELGRRRDLTSNLLAHHLDVLTT